MKKLVAILLASLFVTTAAWAAPVDEDTDYMSLYFDEGATEFCTTTSTMLESVTAYVIWTNPSVDNMHGFDCGFTVTGAVFGVPTKNYVMTGQMDMGTATSFVVGYPAPTPSTEATVCGWITFSVYDMTDPANTYCELFLGASEQEETPLGVYTDGEGNYPTIELGISAPDGPCAQVNAPECTVIPVEENSFGSVKSLFR